MNTDLRTLVKKKLARLAARKGASFDFIRDPVTDWGRMVIVFSLLFLAVVLASVWFFNEVISGRYGKRTADLPTVETLDRTAMEVIVQHYAEKEKRLDELKAAKPAVVDPSL